MQKRVFHPLIRIFNSCHPVFDNQQVVCLGEDEYIGCGDVGVVLKLEQDVVDSRHIQGRGRLPYTSLCGEGEYVHVSGRDIGPLHDGLGLSEEHTGHVVRESTVTIQTQTCAFYGVSYVTPHRLGVIIGVQGEVEAVHVSNGIASAAACYR